MPAPVNCPVYYRDCHRKITREWMPHMTPAAFAVLNFIFDRTLGWSKESEIISYKQIAEGVTVGGITYCHGTGLSVRTIAEALPELSETGFITRQPLTGGAFRYSINFQFNPMLKQSKKGTIQAANGLKLPRERAPRPIGFGDDPHANSAYPPMQELHTPHANSAYKEEQKKEVEKERVAEGDASAVPVQETTAFAIGRANADCAERGKHKTVEALNAVKASIPQLQIVVQAAWADTFVDVPCCSFKQREWLILTGVQKRWEGAEPFTRFLDWSVRLWRYICDSHFSTLKQKPEFFDVGFFARFSDGFQRAWLAKAEIAKLVGMTERQRRVSVLVSRGIPLEIAEEEVAEKLGYAETLRKIQKENSRLHRQRIAIGASARPAQRPPEAPRTPLTVVDETEVKLDIPDSFGSFD